MSPESAIKDVEASQAEVSTDRPEIIITRRLDAPRDDVFRALTDPKQLDQWWGPAGFRNTTHEHDLRPGGTWRYTMHGPDGTDYPNRTVYHDVEPPKRLAYDHGWDRDPFEAMFEGTITLTEEGDGTVIELRMTFQDMTDRDRNVARVDAVKGGKETLARLAAFVEVHA
ncbi:MAG: SRPBCC family protein [Euryarchaeota archaeon]|nr:SRPBCC family protein [Euryarchaeota archaeon]